jgi:hypothetical protein
MRWSTWTAAGARGKGNYVASCYFLVGGNRCANWVLPVTLNLSRVMQCPDGRRIFTRLVIRNPFPEPTASGQRNGKPRPLLLNYNCQGLSRGEGTGY